MCASLTFLGNICVCVKLQESENGFYGNKWCSYSTFALDGKDQRKTQTQMSIVNKALSKFSGSFIFGAERGIKSQSDIASKCVHRESNSTSVADPTAG